MSHCLPLEKPLHLGPHKNRPFLFNHVTKDLKTMYHKVGKAELLCIRTGQDTPVAHNPLVMMCLVNRGMQVHHHHVLSLQ